MSKLSVQLSSHKKHMKYVTLKYELSLKNTLSNMVASLALASCVSHTWGTGSDKTLIRADPSHVGLELVRFGQQLGCRASYPHDQARIMHPSPVPMPALRVCVEHVQLDDPPAIQVRDVAHEILLAVKFGVD